MPKCILCGQWDPLVKPLRIALITLVALLLLLEVAGRLLREPWVPKHSFQADARAGWVLPPSSQFQFARRPVTTNSLGFRSPEPVVGEGVFRVMALGDSTVFGHGVRDTQSFPALLWGLLQARAPADVQNGGVPGYTCPQSALIYERNVERAQPDLLLLYLGNSDAFEAGNSDEVWLLGMPPLLRELGIGRLLTELAIRYKLSRRSPRVSSAPFADCAESLVRAQAARGGTSMLIVPVMDPDFRSGLGSSEEHQHIQAYRDALHRVAETSGAALLDLPAVARASEESPREMLMDLVHPTVEGHAWVAEAILDTLDAASAGPAGSGSSP
jgi:lysophospholipase L1-like esterase